MYKPVSTITATEPIQKLSISMPATLIRTSGKSVLKTTPPAKMPTAILDTMKVTMETIESTYRDLTLKRRSRNSGMVNTFDRM